MIKIKEFDETLRALVRRKPFVPFVVELEDGRSLTIAGPPVFCDGAASYITPDFETMIEFTNEEVVSIRPVQEALQ